MGAEERGRRVRAIAELRGRLRLAHLEAHLETAALLTPDQRQRYHQLRGHGGGRH
jgi:Spy/CpxP family protein refolding chaperone